MNAFATKRSHYYLGDIKIADICLVVFAICCVAFDDGSVLAKASRLIIVVGAIFELRDKRFKLSSYHVWLVVFAAMVFASRFWAFSVSNATGLFSTVLYNVLCFSCAAYLIWGDKRRIRLVMISMVVGSLLLEARVIATAGLFAFLSSRSTESTSANTVGMFTAFGAFISYGLYRESGKKQKVYLVFVALDICFALLSASRKALMVIGLVLILLVLLGKSEGAMLGKAGKFAVALLIVMAAFFMVMNVPFLYELVGVRLEGMINGFFGVGSTVDASTKTRMSLVEYGMAWFADNPIHGYGADNFRALMAVYHPGQTAYYAHNNYVELIVSYGVIGLALYYVVYAQILIVGFKQRRNLSYSYLVLLSLVIGLLIMDYGMVEYYSRDAQLFIMLAWSALAGFKNGANSVDDCVATE